MAQMPTPFKNSHVTATSSKVATAPATPNRTSKPNGVCRVNTMRDIFSVTDLNVCPGAITRYSPVAGSVCSSNSESVFSSVVVMFASTLHRRMFQRRFVKFAVQIQNRGHIGRSRTRIQIRKHLVCALVGAKLRHAAIFVIDVAECDCRGRTRLL